MSAQTVDAFARLATSALNRRVSLTTLGAVALVAGSRPAATRAEKAARKANKRCRRQGAECLDTCLPNCQAAADPEACVALIEACCASLGRCKAAAFLECLFPLS